MKTSQNESAEAAPSVCTGTEAVHVELPNFRSRTYTIREDDPGSIDEIVLVRFDGERVRLWPIESITVGPCLECAGLDDECPVCSVPTVPTTE
jgi:hypothetical protein